MAYFSNGSEGEVFDWQCYDCPLGYGWNEPDQKRLFDDSVKDREPKPCPTALIQLQYNYDQVDNKKLREAMTALVDDDGICQTRKILMQIRQEEADAQFQG
jgi:hypothetical protein